MSDDPACDQLLTYSSSSPQANDFTLAVPQESRNYDSSEPFSSIVIPAPQSSILRCHLVLSLILKKKPLTIFIVFPSALSDRYSLADQRHPFWPNRLGFTSVQDEGHKHLYRKHIPSIFRRRAARESSSRDGKSSSDSSSLSARARLRSRSTDQNDSLSV